MRSIFLKSLWNKCRYYTIVLLCGTFQTAVIFLINVMADCLSVIVNDRTSGAIEVNTAYSIFGYTYVLLFFLMALILTSYIRKRFDDYAMLESLGMKQKYKHRFVAAEYIGIIVISIGAGLAVGRILAAAIIYGLQNVFSDMATQIYYGSSPLKVTVATELVMFGCLFMFFDETIACFGIDSLLQFGKKGGKIYKKKPVRMAVGVLFLLIPFMSLWLYWGKEVPMLPVFPAVIGLYLFMVSIIGERLSGLKKKRRYFKEILWLDNWYHQYFYNIRLSYIIAAFLFIINFCFSISLFDNLPLKMEENYPYDVVWMTDQGDKKFIDSLEEKYGVQAEMQPCIRVISGDIGEQVGISASVYEKWTGKHLDLKENDIYIIYQRERANGDSPGMDYGTEMPSLYIGPPREDLWVVLSSTVTLPGKMFREECKIIGQENGILTGVFQDAKSENIIVFSDDYYNKVREEAYGPNLIAMLEIPGHYDEVMLQISAHVGEDNETLIYEKRQLLFETRSEHLTLAVAVGCNMVVLCLCGIFVLIIKMENDYPEMEWKYELFLRSGMAGKKRRRCIWKEVSLSGRLALLFGLVLSAVFVAAKIYVRQMNTFWTYRYLAEMLILIFGIGLIFVGIVTAFAWRCSKKIERRDENG